jgi:hypothetical protein
VLVRLIRREMGLERDGGAYIQFTGTRYQYRLSYGTESKRSRMGGAVFLVFSSFSFFLVERLRGRVVQTNVLVGQFHVRVGQRREATVC